MPATPKPAGKRSARAFPPLPGKSAAELFGDGAPATNTRQRLLEAALDLFYTYGFHAVGLDRILADVGISKQAFYKHFESKDDLTVEAVRLRDRWESEAFSRQVQERGGDDPRGMLLAIFDVMDEWFKHPDYQGCLFLSACAEFPSPHDPIHMAAADNYRAAETDIQRLASAAGAADPAALARELMMLSQGALGRRLVFADNNAAKAARELALLAIERHIPPRLD